MQVDNLKQMLNLTKDAALNKVLLAIISVMALGLIVSFSRITHTGFVFHYIVHIVFAALLLVIYALRNKVQTLAKGIIFLCILFTMAVSGLFTFGLYSFSYAYFIPAIAMTMFWNNMHSMLTGTFAQVIDQQNKMKKMNSDLIIARDKAEGKSIRLIIEKIERDIYSDKERIKQVLTNLLDNAFKFTKTGEIKLSIKEHNESVSFIISDTGIGISDDDKEKIFDRFYKADPFPNGAGLGLSISKSIAKMSITSIVKFS
ncbi:MAG: HAMP domain-containing sensor histidine kinase [Prolixibacteraceae bacterium]|jgi:anti-sigma regulatory factor (Ser/Thr protein kinase)|nr:HAMP domain-containing sensor histidine kinase [Prolixibacteraceae bacterium]